MLPPWLTWLPVEYVPYVLALFGVCAVASAQWKRPADGSKWLPVWQAVNWLGHNYRYAANAAPPK